MKLKKRGPMQVLGILVMVLGLLVLSALPAAAKPDVSGGGDNVAGLHIHLGAPTRPDPLNPCATYVTNNFVAAYPDSHVEVDRQDYDGPLVAVVSRPPVVGAVSEGGVPDGLTWGENPEGSFEDGLPNNQCAGQPGEPFPGWTTVIAGASPSGVLLCVGQPGETTYGRVGEDVTYEGEVECTLISTGPEPGVYTDSGTARFEENYVDTPGGPYEDPPLALFNNVCILPIAPATCVSQGTLRFS